MASPPQVWFFTFGAGTASYHAAAHRLADQVRAANAADHVLVFTERTLQADFPTWWASHAAYMQANKSGYGYWCWKPFLTQQLLETRLCDGDILVYADAGCEFNANGMPRFREYVALAQQHGAVFFQTKDCPERAYAKRDLLDHLQIGPERHAILDTFQAVGGVWLMQKNTANIALVARWCALHEFDNHRLASDAPSKLPALPGFRAHRHDQAILSLLIKLEHRFQHQDALWYRKWPQGKHVPILAMRSRSGTSRLDRLGVGGGKL